MKKITFLITVILSTSLWAKMQQVPSFGDNPGNLTMYQHIPSKTQAKMPLVIALHGCTQSAAEYEQRSGWSQLASENSFIVIYPEQKSGNNPMMCFNWGGEYGDLTNLIRNKGENKSIIEMINKIKEDHSIDDEKIFITGFSAGGALTANMLALYPDLFKAGSIMAGIPYRCATDLLSSFTCMYQGKVQSAQQWGNYIRDAFSYSGDYPHISIWFGSNDSTVNPINSNELVKQWSNIHGQLSQETREDLNDDNEHSYYLNSNGEKVIRFHRIMGMTHAISVDPDSEFNGGSTGAFSENHGIHSTYVTALEWGIILNN